MRYLFLVLFLTGCASGPSHYVTNEQLRFRLSSYCTQKGYQSLAKGPPYQFKKVYDRCMMDFQYSEDESWVRDDWRSL